MHGHDVGRFEESLSTGRHRPAVGSSAQPRRLARPDDNIHAEGAPVLGDGASDAPVAVHAEPPVTQCVTYYAGLPVPRTEPGHVLWDATSRGEYETPGEFSGRPRW